MWNTISNWWNKEKNELQQKLDDANERLEGVLQGLDKKVAENERLSSELTEIKMAFATFKTDHPDMKADGVITPWFVVGVNGESELKGLKTYMDWNDAMVQHIKDKDLGYKTEDEMIMHFIAQLYEHVLLRIQARVVDDSDKQRPGDFE